MVRVEDCVFTSRKSSAILDQLLDDAMHTHLAERLKSILAMEGSACNGSRSCDL